MLPKHFWFLFTLFITPGLVWAGSIADVITGNKNLAEQIRKADGDARDVFPSNAILKANKVVGDLQAFGTSIQTLINNNQGLTAPAQAQQVSIVEGFGEISANLRTFLEDVVLQKVNFLSNARYIRNALETLRPLYDSLETFEDALVTVASLEVEVELDAELTGDAFEAAILAYTIHRPSSEPYD